MQRDLSRLFQGVEHELVSATPLRGTVTGLSYNSKNVHSGDIFFALQGQTRDGRVFIDEAVKNGAQVVVTDTAFDGRLSVPLVKVSEPRRILGLIARRFYEDPLTRLTVIGITGTNGKTTTSYLVRSVLEAAGFKTGLIGTIAHEVGGRTVRAQNTTPESLDLFALLDEMGRNGLSHAVMEISSHALALHRVSQIDLAVGVYTNLTRDHLDFHANLEEYRAAKLSMLKLVKTGGSVVYNLDDTLARDVERLFAGRRFGYGVGVPGSVPRSSAILRGEIEAVSNRSTRFVLHHGNSAHRITSHLLGRHNVYNIMAAYGVGAALDLESAIVIRGIGKIESVPGRLMPVANRRGLSIFVDYAHTDDALKNVLTAVREFTSGRVIVVFGCGGDRDRGKRPIMGQVATELADIAFVTSDNPRNEAPEAIIKEIVAGIARTNYKVVADRQAAICAAINEAGAEDSVVIAGKGHENYQLVKGETKHFDDTEAALACLN